jgi:hypothetical protein
LWVVDLRDLSESGEGVAERVRLDFRAQVPHENVEMFCNENKIKNYINKISFSLFSLFSFLNKKNPKRST